MTNVRTPNGAEDVEASELDDTTQEYDVGQLESLLDDDVHRRPTRRDVPVYTPRR